VSPWQSNSERVEIRWQGRIAVLLFNRPEQLNALSLPMLEDVGSALRMLGTGEDCDGIVLTGAGRAFSAGDDLPGTEHLERSDFDRLIELFQELTRGVLASRVPVVAALNGIAVGGSAELTLACDARIGHPGSDYLFPENNVGLTISNASTYLLPRLVGSRALPLILDGTRITGDRARALGLIDVFVDSAEEVLPSAVSLLERWCDRGLATRFHLRMLRPPTAEVEAAIAIENEIAAEVWESGIPVVGIRRFLEEQQARRPGR
jgi:enoyl-CoA hydratase/carnithine racemase